MAVNGKDVAFLAVGGIVLFSGIHGSTISDTLKASLTGNPMSAPATQTLSFPTGNDSGGSSSGGGTTNAGSSSDSASANQAIAKQIIQKDSSYSGWDSGTQWTDLVNLWNRESNWSATAKNPTSGAYGIAQALPASKYPAAGQESGGSNPGAQISWGLSYIKSTYGSPSIAWGHETQQGWY